MMGLGTIRTNYTNHTMEFSTQGTTVKLQGERLLKNSGVTNRVVQKMVADDIVASFFHL